MARRLRDERGGHSSGTAIADGLMQPTRTTGPETAWRFPSAPSLFGLAPDGVYRAAPVTGSAVGSYPTLSPLPRRHMGPKDRSAGGAVCFLWHFPWGRPRRTLSGIVFPWSPDFPRMPPFDDCTRGRPADWQAYKGLTAGNGNSQRGRQQPAPLACRVSRWRSAASPCCNRRTKPGSCAWRHGRHCSAGWSRRYRRRPACGPRPDTSCRSGCSSPDRRGP